MQHGLQIVMKSLALASGVGFFSMMVFYFRSGPLRAGDRFMQVAAVLTAAIHFAVFLPAGEVPPVRSGACLALLLLSNALFWGARMAHGTNRPGAIFGGTTPIEIVRSGPYRFVRHPFYLSYVVGFLALSVFAGRWWLYLNDAAIFILYNAAARQEEQVLSRLPQLGRIYSDYVRGNWRWCPFIW